MAMNTNKPDMKSFAKHVVHSYHTYMFYYTCRIIATYLVIFQIDLSNTKTKLLNV